MMMMMWRRRFRFGIWMAMVLQSVALVHGAATRGSTTSFDTRSRRSSLSQSLPSSSGWIRSRGGHPSTMPHPTTKLHYYDVRNWIRGGSDVEAVSSSNEAASPPSTSPANTSYQVSICSVQGGRQYMEDDVFVNQYGNFAAVFDGHGGSAVSRYLRQNLYATLLAALPTGLSSTSSLATVPEPSSRSSNDTDENSASGLVGSQLPTASDYQRAIVTALEKVDQEVQRISHWSFQGSTAVVAWIHEDRQSHNDQTLVVANVGDSRAVLSRNGMAVDLTQDHKPHSRSEKERIERAGGKIVWCGDVDSDGNPIPESGLFRVNGNLAMSRAIGDRSERPAVCATPEVTTCQIQDGDEFVVLASDGVFDVMSSQDVVSFVQQELQQSTSEVSRTRIKAHMADMVVAQALQRGTTDNASVVVVWLTPSRHSEN